MGRAGLLFLISVTLLARTVAAQQAPPGQGPAGTAAPVAPELKPPSPAPVGTMSELMLKVIYPYSDALFYIQRSVPKNEVEWNELQGKALALAEFGNVMMMPGRARDQDQWLRDAKLLAEAGAAAFKLAKAKDVDGIVALNDQLVMSCTSCHMHYRPAYGRRNRPQGQPQAQPPGGSSAPPPAQNPAR
jgi:hypothetical protein